MRSLYAVYDLTDDNLNQTTSPHSEAIAKHRTSRFEFEAIAKDINFFFVAGIFV
jgi:hypothetical protein